MEGLRPFGDAARDLRLRVKRVSVAVRAFVQGLSVGRDVIRRVSQVPTWRGSSGQDTLLPLSACSSLPWSSFFCFCLPGYRSLRSDTNRCLGTVPVSSRLHTVMSQLGTCHAGPERGPGRVCLGGDDGSSPELSGTFRRME